MATSTAGERRDFESCVDIQIIANLWRGKWAVLRNTPHTPAERHRKLSDLNAIGRHLAALARGRRLDLAELRHVSDVELAILKEELHWPQFGQTL